MSGRLVGTECVFDRHGAAVLSAAYAILVPQRRARIGPARKDGRSMTSAAIYARVSSARQKKDETIGSQTAALRGQSREVKGRARLSRVFGIGGC